MEAIETAARRQALAVAARAVAQRLNADHRDHVGPTVPCVWCQQPAQYAGRHAKTFESVLGPLPLERAYYHCAACAAGFCPRDAALGLTGTSLSPAVTRMVGTVGAMVSFVEGHALLHDLAGVDVDTKQVERTAEALGRAIADDERTVAVPPLPARSACPALDRNRLRTSSLGNRSVSSARPMCPPRQRRTNRLSTKP